MKVRITTIHTDGEEFENLTPDSVHDTVHSPEGYHGETAGRVWVLGADNEPVMLFEDEYILIA